MAGADHRRYGDHAGLITAKESGALIPFVPWPAQVEALKVIEGAEKLVIPKGRQVGQTYLELAYMLWAGTFFAHRLFLIARQSDEYARDAITRLLILAGYDPNGEAGKLQVLPESALPPQWRPQIVAKTQRSLTFANGSSYRALTATQPIARGLAAYMGLADEFAFWPWPARQHAAMESGCAHLHVISTGNGEGDAFHALYANAIAGRGSYRAFFLPADADPRRDAEWFRCNVEEAAEPAMARREYARRPADAFAAPGERYFERFDPERHVCDIEIVPNWESFCALDFGFRHAACLFVQRSPAGALFIVDELLPTNVTTPEFAAAINQRLASYGLVEPIVGCYCDPAGRGVNTQTAVSEFDCLQDAGPWTEGTPSSIRDGCVRIMDSLADPDQPLLIASRCTGLIKALSQVRPHRSRPECYDFDHEIYSHPVDALRYLLINISPPIGDWLPERPERGFCNQKRFF